MQISQENKNRYLYEYAFWDVVRTHNDALDDKKACIRTSEARAFRKTLGDMLKKEGYSLETCPMSRFTKAVNGVLKDRMGYAPYKEESGKDALFSKSLQTYVSMTGMKPKVNEWEGENLYLPISPYDPRYSDRKAILENGSRLSSLRVSDIENVDDLHNDLYASSRILVYGEPYGVKLSDGSFGYTASESSLHLLEEDDRSGMTMLMPYMTKEEYADVSEWVNRDLDPTISASDLLARKKYMKKAVAILDTLQDMGRAYSIRRDEYPGQIKANIKGTKFNVRLTEKKGTEAYIGSLYDDGVRYLFSTTRRDNRIVRTHEPTLSDTTDLLRFALGEKVMRKDEEGKVVGENEVMERGAGRGKVEYNAAYVNGSGFTAVYRNLDVKNVEEAQEEARFQNKVRMVADTKNRTSDTTTMLTADDAKAYLSGMINNARENYLSALDVDRLLKEYEAHKDEREEIVDEEGNVTKGAVVYTPQFDGNANISVIQQSYWDVLTGKKDTLLKPFAEGEDTIGDVGENQASSLASAEALSALSSYDPKVMSPSEIVKLHAKESVEKVIGSFEKQEDGFRFDPVGVSTFAASGCGIYRNNDDIVKAMRMLSINPDELRGDATYNGTVKDRLLRFEEKGAVKMKEMTNPFAKDVYNTLVSSLKERGISVDEEKVLFDQNGVISYEGTYANTEATKERGNNTLRPRPVVKGEIGQVFLPDEKGVVTTKYAGSDNFSFVPGYLAHIRLQKVGENKTMEERTLLKGYKQRLLENIRYQVTQDVLSLRSPNAGMIGETTSVNTTYKGIEATRYAIGFEKAFLEQGMDEDVLDAILKTQAQRVRYSNEVRDGSSIHADFRASQYEHFDYANDNFADPYSLTGNRNISVLTEESDGYFDPIATTSTSINQGAVRYLVDGAVVNADGTITPSADKNDRTAIFHHPITAFSEFDPYDRQCMMLSNVMQANSVSKPTKSMDITLGSWTQDDAIVVTKSFADRYPMRKNDGTLRPLVVQDKLSDMHGNKGVISYVLDPTKTEAELRLDSAKLGFKEEQFETILKMHELAKKNPDVEVFMAPFTHPSRFNAGTAREKMQNASDAMDLEGNVVPGGVGTARFIITDKSVEAKTHIYDEEQILKGKGRKASGQLAWSLSAKGATKMMQEFFGPNTESTINAREYLLSMGMDLSPTGEVLMGYEPHAGEERNVFLQPELSYAKTSTGKDRLDVRRMTSDFAKELSRRGGIMELPFSLTYPTGEDIPPMDDGKRDVIYQKTQWERKGYTRKDGIYVRPTTVVRKLEKGERQVEPMTWGLPVMSAHLRSGQEFVDGASVIHDYTNQYLNIFREAVKYRDYRKKMEETKDEAEKLKYAKAMGRNQKNAQDFYNGIVKDLEKRKFSGKHNLFRDELMARRLPNSATSVWSPDPRLPIDTVAVGVDMAKALGILAAGKEAQEVLVWRDPILHDSNLRYMKVLVNGDISGCAINPNMDIPFDGDFDGDTVALVKLQTKAAQKEARECFSVGANLVNTGHTVDMEYQGKSYQVYPLNMNDGLDIQVAKHLDKGLDEEWKKLTLQANALYHASENGDVVGVKKERLQDGLVNALTSFYEKAANVSFGKAQIRYDNLSDHLQSVYQANIETGAKGSPKKVASYATYLGVDGVSFDDTKADTKGLVDHKKTLTTREMQQGVMIATNVKNVGTGFAGSVSQRAMRAIGDKNPKVATELSYPATQSILQSKHDPVDAKRRFGLLLRPMRQLWEGRSLTYNQEKSCWVASKEQATPEDWKKSFYAFYTSDVGMGVSINPKYVSALADALTDEHMGTMKSVEMEAEANDGKTEGTLLYRMAYGGNFETLAEAAKKREKLFDGTFVEEFTPFTIRKNEREETKRATMEKEGITIEKSAAFGLLKSDSQKEGKPKRVTKQQSVAVNLPKRQIADVPTVSDTSDLELM